MFNFVDLIVFFHKRGQTYTGLNLDKHTVSIILQRRDYLIESSVSASPFNSLHKIDPFVRIQVLLESSSSVVCRLYG